MAVIMSTFDDQALVRKCLAGETEAFGELIDRHQRALFNTALRMTGDSEEAADLTQGAFVKAYEKLDSYRPEHKFFSWIYRILVNETINALKQRRQQQGLDMEPESSDPTPDELHETNVRNLRIETALRELSFDYRLVIVLRYFNDMSYQEMSEILAVPEKTVKSRLYSARQNLASILGRMGVVTL